MKLIDAPVGMFEYNGTLALKTEYSTEVNGIGTPDCYIVDSGEFFWGGTYYADERNNLEVEPVEVEVVRHGKWIDRGWDGDFSWQIDTVSERHKQENRVRDIGRINKSKGSSLYTKPTGEKL